jgi:hypothetical protein
MLRDAESSILLGNLKGVVRPEGLEPPAYRFEACRSIQLSYGRKACFTTTYVMSLSRRPVYRI